jgi:hypothetical protein
MNFMLEADAQARRLGNVKLSLCLIKHHAMKIYTGSWRVASPFLTSDLDGGERLASRPVRFAPGERAPGINWIGG